MIDQTDRRAGDPDQDAGELEGAGTEQTWGHGEGAHEPTIPSDEDSASADDDEEMER